MARLVQVHLTFAALRTHSRLFLLSLFLVALPIPTILFVISTLDIDESVAAVSVYGGPQVDPHALVYSSRQEFGPSATQDPHWGAYTTSSELVVNFLASKRSASTFDGFRGEYFIGAMSITKIIFIFICIGFCSAFDGHMNLPSYKMWEGLPLISTTYQPRNESKPFRYRPNAQCSWNITLTQVDNPHGAIKPPHDVYPALYTIAFESFALGDGDYVRIEDTAYD